MEKEQEYNKGITSPSVPFALKKEYYPTHISSLKYKHLLSIQAYPESRIIFKDKEVTMEELVSILEKL